MCMRPEISDALVERIDELSDQHGYESAAEFIRDATRRRIEQLTNQKKINGHTTMSEELTHPLEISCDECDFSIRLDCYDPSSIDGYECPDCDTINE